MSDKATLLALAERVEGLDGPNFATENEIGAAVGFDFEEELGGAIRRAPLPYTASLDAALTLVPEGWAWSVGFDTHGNRAITGPMGSLDAFVGKAATPALALCAAALRARAEALQ